MTKWQNKWQNKKCLLIKVSCFSQVQTLPGELTASPAIRFAPWPAPMCPLYLVSFVNRDQYSFNNFDGRGGRGNRDMLPGFVPLGAAQARHRNYAVADLTEKAKRGCVSPTSTGEEKRRGLLPGFVPLGAAQARHRNYAVADLTEKAKRGCVSPFLLNLVEHIGVEPMTSCMPCRRSSQLS